MCYNKKDIIEIQGDFMEMSKEERLGTAPIGRLMVGLSIPCIVAQVINVLYNIVDRAFIGHIEGVGSTALTGVGLTLPILMLVSAFSTFAATGGSALASMQLGKGDREKAEKILGTSTWLLLVFSAALMAVFYLFNEPFLYMFGASARTMPFASEYLKIYLVGTVFVEMALGLNNFIIIQGRPGIAMCSILAGAVFNMILDPIFIFTLDMGVRGAAVATVISQFLSAMWNLVFLCGNLSTLKIKMWNIRCETEQVKKILSLGIAPFTMRATECLISIVMNRQLQIYGGDLYVGSMTILQSVILFVCSPITGITQGVPAIISYNFGAGNFDRVRKTYRCLIRTCLLIGFMTTASEMLFPGFYAGFFTTDPELINLVVRVMPFFVSGLLIFGMQDAIQCTFLALGQSKISFFIASLRKIVLLVPLALILPSFLGIKGVYMAEPISDTISVLTACAIFRWKIDKILSKENLERI